MAQHELDLFATWRQLADTAADVPAQAEQNTPPLSEHDTPSISEAPAPALPEQSTPPFPGHTAPRISELAVAPLELMLEALLRVHDFKSFEVLLGALELTPLQPRKRRELLARMYLRRGFLASAAQEWMAVCEREPDVQALLGLARVAAARGMAHEMSDFAAAALSRDPDNEDAASLLSQAHAATA